jgi:hypothetical protein
LEKAKIHAKNLELMTKVIAVVDYLDKVETIDRDNKQLKDIKEAFKQILEKKEIEDKVMAVKEYIDNVAETDSTQIVRQSVMELLDTSEGNIEKVKAEWISKVQAENQKKL